MIQKVTDGLAAMAGLREEGRQEMQMLGVFIDDVLAATYRNYTAAETAVREIDAVKRVSKWEIKPVTVTF